MAKVIDSKERRKYLKSYHEFNKLINPDKAEGKEREELIKVYLERRKKSSKEN